MKKTICVFLALTFIGLPLEARAQYSAMVKYSQMVQNYYRNPQPNKVPKALLQLLDSEFVTSGEIYKNGANYLLAYTFGRIAQKEPSLIPLYKEVFETTEPMGRAFMINIFQICGSEDLKKYLTEKLNDPAFATDKDLIEAALTVDFPLKFDPLTLPLNQPRDIDMLWAEFFVTGDPRAIDRIISALDFPDVLRQRIEDYLAGDASPEDKVIVVERVKELLDIDIDPETFEFQTNQVLGPLLMVRARREGFSQEDFGQLEEQLGITNEDFVGIAVQGAALFTIQNSSTSHQRVFELCEQALGDASDQVKILLSVPVARGHFRLGNFAKARDYLIELITVSPNRPLLHSFLAEVYLAMDDFRSAQMQLDYIRRRDPIVAAALDQRIRTVKLQLLQQPAESDAQSVDDISVIIDELSREQESLISFESYAVIGDGINKAIEWDVDYVAPDRYAVEQSMWQGPGGSLNKWIKIGTEVYTFVGMWFKDTAGATGYEELTETLRLEKWIDSLAQSSNPSAMSYREGEEERIYVSYLPDDPTVFFQNPLPDKAKVESAEVWIDPNTNMILKGVLKLSVPVDEDASTAMVYEQIFYNFNTNLSIQPPEDAVLITEQDTTSGTATTPESTASGE